MPHRRWHSAAARSVMAVTGAHDARDGMVELAIELLAEAEIRTAPFSLAQVASFRGIRRPEYVAMQQAGRLVPEGGGYLVQLNIDHAAGKQQFTFGHEIGHTLVPAYQAHPRRIEDWDTGHFAPNQEEEYLCDTAAAELLMPTALFKPMAAAQGFNLKALEDLRRLFRASREAAAIRLVRTDLWPCAFVIWHEAHKPTEQRRLGHPMLPGFETSGPAKKLRIRYAVCSSSFGYFLPQHLSAEQNGCLAQCLQTGGVVDGTEPITLHDKGESFYITAAAVDFDGNEGPKREVLSLLMPDAAPRSRCAVQPELWSASEE